MPVAKNTASSGSVKGYSLGSKKKLVVMWTKHYNRRANESYTVHVKNEASCVLTTDRRKAEVTVLLRYVYTA